MKLERKTTLASLSPGEALHASDKLDVGRKSRVEIDAGPNTRLILHRNSVLVLEHVGYERQAFRIFKGRLSAEMLGDDGRELRLETHDSNTSVEGLSGDFSVLDLADGRVTVAAIRGKVRLTTNGKNQRTLSAGTALRIFEQTNEVTENPIMEKVLLEIEKPIGPLRTGSKIPIAGRTDTHARLWINGKQRVTQKDGSFNVLLTVDQGDSVEIVAEDVAGNNNVVELGPAVAAKTRHRILPPPKRVKTKSYRITW